MTQYVLGFALDTERLRVLLIMKRPPTGRWNGLGGKVEEIA